MQLYKTKENSRKPGTYSRPPESRLKAIAEKNSGLSMSNVMIHYNSEQPAKFNAYAFTRGADIFVSPGMEHFIPHEMGHVVEQKTGRVPITSHENGQPVNTSPYYEKRAESWMSRRYEDKGETRLEPVIQKASVGVTLSPLVDNSLTPDQVKIDTINLPKRFDTGLSTKKQGDHTIADVLVKRFQKHALMGQTLDKAILFYNILFTEILNTNPETDITDLETRISSSNKLALKGIAYTQHLYNPQLAQPLPIWNILMKDIIKTYNEAYAYSYLSTTISESAPVGHGESSAMKDIKNKSPLDYRSLRLIDVNSVKRLDDLPLAIPSGFYGISETDLINQHNQYIQQLKEQIIESLTSYPETFLPETFLPDSSEKNLQESIERDLENLSNLQEQLIQQSEDSSYTLEAKKSIKKLLNKTKLNLSQLELLHFLVSPETDVEVFLLLKLLAVTLSEERNQVNYDARARLKDSVALAFNAQYTYTIVYLDKLMTKLTHTSSSIFNLFSSIANSQTPIDNSLVYTALKIIKSNLDQNIENIWDSLHKYRSQISNNDVSAALSEIENYTTKFSEIVKNLYNAYNSEQLSEEDLTRNLDILNELSQHIMFKKTDLEGLFGFV